MVDPSHPLRIGLGRCLTGKAADDRHIMPESFQPGFDHSLEDRPLRLGTGKQDQHAAPRGFTGKSMQPRQRPHIPDMVRHIPMRECTGEGGFFPRIGDPAFVEPPQPPEEKETNQRVEKVRDAGPNVQLMGDENGGNVPMIQPIAVVADHRIPSVDPLLPGQPTVFPPNREEDTGYLPKDAEEEEPPVSRISHTVTFQRDEFGLREFRPEKPLRGTAASDGDPAAVVYEKTDQGDDPGGMTQSPIQWRYEYLLIFDFSYGDFPFRLDDNILQK